jgi:tetratricopeptide (TPR) repeat protein
MKFIPAPRLLLTAVIGLALALLFPAQSHAASRILDRLVVLPGAQTNQVLVRFNVPVRYVTHAPAATGHVLQIQLRPVLPQGSEEQDRGHREALAWKSSETLPLVEVSYESFAPQPARLTLRLATPAQKPKPPAASAPKPQSAPGTSRPQAATVGSDVPVEFDPSYRYVINLQSSRRAVVASTLPVLEALRGYRLYTTRFVKDDTVWNRLRLGFFPTRGAAEKVRAAISRAYPDAWLAKVSKKERDRSARTAINLFAPGGAAPTIATASKASQARPEVPKQVPATASPPAAKAKGQVDLMKEAADAMTAGAVRRAIQIYTKILQSRDHADRQQAQELLGLARERNGQLAHAKAEYEEYLRLYPEGEAAGRVRQRLAGLLTARAKPQEKLPKAEGPAEDETVEWGLSGSFAQFYHRDETFSDFEGRRVNQSEVDSGLDVTGRVRTDRYDANLRASGSYLWDLSSDGPGNDGRISALYLDGFDSQLELFGRIGRQSRSSGGVLGRYDGALVSYQAFPKIKVNGVAGFPVVSTRDLTINDDRYFYGFSLDLGTFAGHWDSNLFVVNQEADGITDRRAVGGEVRYFDPNLTAFGLVDYDIYYNDLNIALLTGNYTFPDRTTVNLSVDYRNSPILTTTSALIGQTVGSVSELLDTFSDSAVRDLARDRTATSKSATIGVSRPLNETFQVSADVTATELTGTKASGGVEAAPGTGIEFFYSAQLIGSNVIKQGDIGVLGLRYADTDGFDRYTIDINTRYPVNRSFRVRPRVRTDYRENKNDDATIILVKPSARFIYYWKRELQLELDIGGEWSDERRAGDSDESFGLFLNLGYRVDF